LARRKYANPPIIEALCELTFELPSDTHVNLVTLPGLLQANLGKVYPGIPRQQRLQSITLESGEDPSQIRIQDQPFRLQLVNEDSTRVLSVGQNTLAVSALRPYGDEGWEGEFKPRISEALAAYMEIASPISVIRIGVRYINKIEVPEPFVDASDYFTRSHDRYEGCRLTAFLNRLEFEQPDKIKILLTHGTVNPTPPNRAAYLLDIDTIWDASPLEQQESVIEKIDELHDRGGKIFEEFITDKARELFDARIIAP
jgi:uncharacterized protein (TIGR04255 family)